MRTRRPAVWTLQELLVQTWSHNTVAPFLHDIIKYPLMKWCCWHEVSFIAFLTSVNVNKSWSLVGLSCHFYSCVVNNNQCKWLVLKWRHERELATEVSMLTIDLWPLWESLWPTVYHERTKKSCQEVFLFFFFNNTELAEAEGPSSLSQTPTPGTDCVYSQR